MNRSRASPVAVNGTDPSFQILHGRPARLIEAGWRACLADSDFSTHYTAPEYFCDPMLHGRGRNGFAAPSERARCVRAM